MGFKVIILDDNSVITNSVSKTTDTLKCGTTFVMLIWNKQAIEEVAALNAIQEKEETLSTMFDLKRVNCFKDNKFSSGNLDSLDPKTLK